MLQTTWWFSRNRRRMVKMSAICLVIFLCVLAVKSQLIYPANNDGQQTLQDMLHILESQKKNSDLTLSGQASIWNMCMYKLVFKSHFMFWSWCILIRAFGCLIFLVYSLLLHGYMTLYVQSILTRLYLRLVFTQGLSCHIWIGFVNIDHYDNQGTEVLTGVDYYLF